MRCTPSLFSNDKLTVSLTRVWTLELQSHQKLSLKKSEKFHKWHQAWARSHLSSHQTEFAHQWLMGKLPDYHQNTTRVLTDNPLNKPPYHPYNRYQVKLLWIPILSCPVMCPLVRNCEYCTLNHSCGVDSKILIYFIPLKVSYTVQYIWILWIQFIFIFVKWLWYSELSYFSV